MFTVGICQLVQHEALDAATQGFKDVLTEELGDKVTFDEQNAAGDSATCTTICNRFVSEKVDLIMANATPRCRPPPPPLTPFPFWAPPSPITAPLWISRTGPAPPARTSPAPPTWLLWTDRPPCSASCCPT